MDCFSENLPAGDSREANRRVTVMLTEEDDQFRRNSRKGKKKQKAALVPTRGEVIDVLERVPTKGVKFEVEEGGVVGSEAGGAGAWFRVSIAGVDVFKIEAGLSWRYLFEKEEKE